MKKHNGFQALVFALVLAVGLPTPVSFHDGTRLKGTFVQATADAFVLASRSRGQVMASTIRYENLQVIQKANNWKPKGKTMWIFLAAGAVFITLALMYAKANAE
jgi:hypothetical protein